MQKTFPVTDIDPAILESVEPESPVYLTCDGRERYAILEIEELRKLALAQLLNEIEEGRRSGEEEGWISAEEIRRRHLGEAI